jgi:hypothetical protein
MAWLGVDPMKAALRIPLASSRLRSFPPLSRALLQRKCACGGTPGPTGECGSCRKKKLQRRSENLDLSSITHPPSSFSKVPPIVGEVLRSSGQRLDSATRAFMEPRFGHDFSRVQIHTDPKASESARAVQAEAYTVGRDIVFAAGRYAPGTVIGRRLLAHELAHVTQQNGADGGGQQLVVGSPGSASEREAEDVALTIERISASVLDRQSCARPLLRRAPVSLLRQTSCESRVWPSACVAPGGCSANQQCVAMQDWPVCGCWDTSGAERRMRSLVPNWILALLSALAVLALIACFASGVCELGIILGGLGTAAAAALMLILRGLGLGDNNPPTVASADAQRPQTENSAKST